MQKIVLTLTLSVAMINIGFGQSDGTQSFRFLDVPVSARLSGLGGVNVSRTDVDINLITSNPALVFQSLDGDLSLNYILYPGEIKVSNITYSNSFGTSGNWTANLVYFNYGEIDSYDDTGAMMGTFNANDYAITIGKSHQVGNYRLGVNLKYASSTIADYNASALLMDLGGIFIHPEKDFTVGLTIKNLGVTVNEFTDDSKTKLPFDLQAGTSFKPLHMPVRFSISFYNLTDWSEPDAEFTRLGGYDSPSPVDQFFIHTIFGTELIIGKYINVLFGYDHKKRRELKLTSVNSAAGFSYGLMVFVRSFEFGFSRASYHVAGTSNTFTLTADISNLIRKKEIIE